MQTCKTDSYTIITIVNCYITKSMVVKSGQANRPTRTKISNKIGLGGNKITQVVSKLIII